MPNRDIVTHFSKVPVDIDTRRSVFHIDPTLLTSFKVGDLVPFFVDMDIMPGDTIKVSTSHLLRMATPFVPVMDNSYFDYFWFFVPNRLVWTDWEKFITGGDEPDSFTSFTEPTMPAQAITPTQSNLAGYMGLPYGKSINVSPLPFRAYRKIWNDWFRNEAMQSYAPFVKTSGLDATNYQTLLKVNKYKDYFTSCLPAPQKGYAVNIFRALTAPVMTSSADMFGSTVSEVPIHFHGYTISDSKDEQLMGYSRESSSKLSMNKAYDASVGHDNIGFVDSPVNLYATLPDLTINALRLAFASQRALEKDARAGSRINETIYAHFGVTCPDARLQRAEYLGGGHVPIQVNQVLQNSATASEVTPLGHVAAMSKTVAGKYDFEKSFTEHGILMCVACVRTAQTYQQGIHRMWRRKSRFDYYWPVFANIGEQPVLKGEIYADNDGIGSTNGQVFGYQEAWAEYRSRPSMATGLMNSKASGSLDIWHYGNDFSALPTLNDDFVKQDRAGFARTEAVTNQDDFISDTLFDMYYSRVMPTFSLPGLIDHF